MARAHRQDWALVVAVGTGLAAATALVDLRCAWAERTALTTAPVRQIISLDRRTPADRARYAAALTDAPLDTGLFNRWIAALPEGATRTQAFALLRRMGFRDTDTQLNIMADSLERGDRAQFALRLDALLAQATRRGTLLNVLSRMERSPQWRSFVADRLSRRPVWRNQYLFNAALLADAAGRGARLQLLLALADDGNRATAAFASRESWKRGDVDSAAAFWRVAGATASVTPAERFPFDWWPRNSADFEATQSVAGDRMAFGVRWNGHGDAPFVSRNLLGPFVGGTTLAAIAAKPATLDLLTVRYRCQGGRWRSARRQAHPGGVGFGVDEPLDCPAGEVAVVPTDATTRANGGEVAVNFTLPRVRPDGGAK